MPLNGGGGLMRRYLFMVVSLIALFVSLNSCSRLYVLSVKEYPTIEGGISWVLDYSLDGMVYSAVFDTREEVVQYYSWLRKGRSTSGGLDER